jgi:opacity protein-like surface antigen
MRKVSTLLGLTLFALASTASAREAAPAPDTATPPPGAPAAASNPEPATANPPAGDAVAAPNLAPAAAQPAASQRKIQVGLSFLPMAAGKYTFSDTFTTTASTDAYFASGIGLSAGYEVLPGLVVGVAPQVIFNVQPKPMDAANPPVAREYDLMARVAYGFRVGDTFSVYAEVLPGYSRIAPSDDTSPSEGLVLALGAGCTMDMTDRFFLNLGGGYQMGFQSQTTGVHKMELRTKYVRVAMGGGVKF